MEARNAQHAYFSAQVSRVLVRYFAADLAGRHEILDYGAGRGDLIEDLLNAGFRTAGLDLSPGNVAGVAARFGSHQTFSGAYHVDEIERLTGRFDAAFLCEVVEHLYEPQFMECLARIKRLLKIGGVLIVTTPNDEDLAKNSILSPESGKLFHRWQHVRSFSVDGLST